MTDSLINDNNNNNNNTPPQLDPDKDYLKELIGPGGKFYDPDEKVALQKLARGKVEADSYVSILERSKDELRNDYLELKSEYDAGARLQELIDKMSGQQLPQSNSENTQNANENMPPVIKPEEIESLVSSSILRHETERKQTENFRLVQNKLKEQYGENYSTVVREQMEQLGLDKDTLDNLARQSPNALLKALGVDAKKTQEGFQTPPRSGVRSDNFSPNTNNRTWAWYQNLKRTDPKLYNSPKTTVQMQKDYMELGPAFEDGDFHSR